MFAVIADWDVDVSLILLVVADNGHVIFLVDVTGDVVFPVGTVNGDVVVLVVNIDATVDVFFLAVGVTGDVVFPVSDSVYDLRVVAPVGISHNTLTSPPLPPEKSCTSL